MKTSRIIAAAAVAVTGLAASSALGGIVFQNDFSGTSPFTFTHNNVNPSATVVSTVAGGVYRVTVPSTAYNAPSKNLINTSSLISQSWADGDFSMSVDVAPITYRNTGGSVGIYGFENTDAFQNRGIGARVVTGYNLSTPTSPGFMATLQLQVDGITVETSASFVHCVTVNNTSYNLTLVGNYLNDSDIPNSDLQLTAVFTPKAGSNPAGLDTITISKTVAASTINFVEDGLYQSWGIMQFGSNGIDMTYDNFTVYNHVIPEPATLGLVAVLGGGLLAMRRLFLM